jgi:putative Mn2+ efflux pump MntP
MQEQSSGGKTMTIITILLIAVGLAMDAFAVSISTGMTVCDFRNRHNLKMSLFFGAFQFGMPVIGYFFALRARIYIEKFDHWIAFGLLAFVGGKMLWEAWHAKSEKELLADAPACPVTETSPSGDRRGQMAADFLTTKRLLVLAVATSIDALAVGVSLSLLQTDIWLPAALIGVVAFVFSFIGGVLGCRIGPSLGKIAEVGGGIILIGIGVKILLDHLCF